MMRAFLLSASAYLSAIFLSVFTVTYVKYLHVSVDFTINQIIAVRGLMAGLLMTPTTIWSVRLVQKCHLKQIIFVGCVALLDAYLWHHGASVVPINNVTVVSFLLPVLIVFFAHFFLKEPIYAGNIFALILIFVAIVCLQGVSRDGSVVGYFLLVADVVLGAIGFVMTKRLTTFYPPFLIVYLKILIMLPISLLLIGSLPRLTYHSIIFLFVSALVYVAERYLFVLAYKLHDMGPLQPLRFFNLLFSFILSYALLSEKVTQLQLAVGAVVVFANLIGIFWKTRLSTAWVK